jgi:predicted CXXCH cytochrome family protein
MNLQLSKFIKTRKKILFQSLASLALVSAGSASAGTIVGSPHDMSAQGWSGGEICVVCHTPHNADTTVTEAPLWNHTVTTDPHIMYASTSFDGAATISTEPTGASKLCLSCHDGTVAIDSFGGATGTSTIQNPNAIFGTDLSNDHPISFTYDDNLATTDGALAEPSTTTVTIGDATDSKTGLLADLMVPGGQLQCNSCHDVHNKFAVAATKLLRISNANSDLCLTCHTK